MKITLQTDKGEKEIEMQQPKGKHIKKLWSYFIKIEKGEAESFQQLLIYFDDLISELTGLTIDELDELPATEKLKLIDIPKQQALDLLDFTKLSPKPGSALAGATPK